MSLGNSQQKEKAELLFVNWIALTLPTSQFAYSHFAYMFHFAYKCVSFRLHMGSYDLEGLSRDKTDFDLLWLTTLGDLVGRR